MKYNNNYYKCSFINQQRILFFGKMKYPFPSLFSPANCNIHRHVLNNHGYIGGYEDQLQFAKFSLEDFNENLY